MTEKLDKPYQIRLSDEFWHDVDEWRRKQPDIPSRAEAIRVLVGRGLRRASLKALGKKLL